MKSLFRATVFALTLAAGFAAFAQDTPTSPSGVMTNEDVIALSKAGIDKAVIISKISSSKTKFDTSTDALILLKQAAVADEVVAAMIIPPKAVSSETTKPARLKDELTSNFNRLKNSVVTVWSEYAHGTGFLFDESGLILTNQHVVGPSTYIAVQFDNERKVAATLLASDPKLDVAVLRVDYSAFPGASVAHIAVATEGEPSLVEGERVFTIGSPLNQKKILTTGIASKIEDRAILSDVNINHGNSGGPLFNSLGEVVGITTFGDGDGVGPGVSGIVRIEQADKVIDEARAKMPNLPKPSAELLPVEPNDTFPIDAIKEVASAKKFDEKPYFFGVDNFNVAVLTPLITYRIQTAAEREAAKSHDKRTKKEGAIQGTVRPFDQFRNWGEYVGEYKPVLLVQATPELGESFWGAFGRGLAANYGIHTQAKLHFKTDFHRMKIFCGDTEVQPIQPGKIPFMKSESNYFVSVQDASFVGFYAYPADAISPACGKVRMELFSEKEPEKAHTKEIDKKLVAKIAEDFKPYLAARSRTTTTP